jgi:hypothetical protein
VLRRLSVAAVSLAALGASSGVGAAGAGEVGFGSCGWGNRSDPVLFNVLYPDEDAVYYAARLPAPPPGVEYRIRGQFPHARYMSFVSYNGLPMDALLDVDIPPDPGSTNPFRPRARRTATRRDYTVHLVPTPPPADPALRQPGALYVGGGQRGSPAPTFYLFYRIYVPDRGTGARGGVPLPSIEAVGPDQSVDLSPVPCEAVRDEIAAAMPPVQEQYAGTSGPLAPPASVSANDPPTWTVESGLTAALLGLAGQDDAVTGGPASNPHNRYLAANVSRGHGEVLAIRAKAPTTPKTYLGQPVMGTGDLRYWSFCQNSRTTRYVACLSDSHVELDRHGYYTIAISDPAHRPATARNWLPFGPEAQGQLLYRHMLPSAGFFPHSAQGVAASGEPIEEAMGEYYPRGAYCSVARFDQDACGLNEARR